MSATSTMTTEVPHRRVMSLQTPPIRASSLRGQMRFGQYILGQTLGEGEFGKVKLGWAAHRNGTKDDAQVAIKLIRRESIGVSKSRMNKIEREISVLKQVSHTNIVKCHEVIETEKYIGIILEYASGGELFDYILAHRYLKDMTACKLFAQLISAVQYLHMRGIVHRDLKLENLLLDRNRNIIITDFGFANTFIAASSPSNGLHHNATAAGSPLSEDLMQTSCGSPCYAAPELVVGDGLYCGRKVDIWSCGVILYAMLAGYLPFDDDPSNPEGDNISLLYKYIVGTSLTFPEYVTPLARDLLRRILVPDPEHRALLSDIITHSWLLPQARVLTTCQHNLKNLSSSENASAITAQDMIRSASERTASHANHILPVDNHLILTGFTKNTSMSPADRKHKTSKRHTVQIEYQDPSPYVQHISATAHKIPTCAPDPISPVSLSMAAAPSMARSASHSGADHVRPITKISPIPGEFSSKVKTKGSARGGRPRPASYHPASAQLPELEAQQYAMSSTVVNRYKLESPGLTTWNKGPLHISKTASPRSTKQNVSGEMSVSKSNHPLQVGREAQAPSKNLVQVEAVVRQTAAMTQHKRNSSLSTLFGKLWPINSHKPDVANIDQKTETAMVMSSIEELTTDYDPRRVKNCSVTGHASLPVEQTDLQLPIPQIVHNTAPCIDSVHDLRRRSIEIAGTSAVFGGQRERKSARSAARLDNFPGSAKISTSAARRVMDFFTGRRRDKTASDI